MMALAQTDFRNVNWGMSKEQVKKLETAVFISNEKTYIMYSTTVNGFDCILMYIFTEDNKLSGARYSFEQKHTNNNSFIDDYTSLKSLLTTKYSCLLYTSPSPRD